MIERIQSTGLVSGLRLLVKVIHCLTIMTMPHSKTIVGKKSLGPIFRVIIEAGNCRTT